MSGFLEKLENFFSEPENYLPGSDPVEAKGERFLPYTAKKDPDAVWPNTFCAGCGHLELKKRLYFAPEKGIFLHPGCLHEEEK